MNNFATEIAPKIHLFQDPVVYLRPPMLTFHSLPQVNKTYSNENYFNQEAYKEFKNSKNFKEEHKKYIERGSIFDIKI